MAAIADSSENSNIDITMQRQSPLIEETPPITYAPTKKNKLKGSDRVLFYEDYAGKKRKL